MITKPGILIAAVFLLLLVWVNAISLGDLKGLLLVNQQYKQSVHTESRLTTKDEIGRLIKDENWTDQPRQSYRQLQNNQIYLVVRAMNMGNQGVWGRLVCDYAGRNTTIDVPFLPAGKKEWNYYVISLGRPVFPVDDTAPDVALKWDELHTK